MGDNKKYAETNEIFRESYTLPKNEHQRLNNIQNKFSGIKPLIKKSEIVRVGIYSVQQLKEKDVKKILEEKLGRLSSGRKRKKAKSEESPYSGEIVINNNQWDSITEFLPISKKSEGRPQALYRQVINGILYIFRYEVQRRNIPKELSSYATCRRRLVEWKQSGFWKKVCNSLISHTGKQEKHDLERILLRTWLIETNRKIE